MDYNYTNLYYDGPTQVKYYLFSKDTVVLGVAYKDTIIDLETGYTYPIENIIVSAKNFKNFSCDDAIIELGWKSLNYE